jgi:hypothetical protein
VVAGDGKDDGGGSVIVGGVAPVVSEVGGLAYRVRGASARF